jgi:hypothetical protein
MYLTRVFFECLAAIVVVAAAADSAAAEQQEQDDDDNPRTVAVSKKIVSHELFPPVLI